MPKGRILSKFYLKTHPCDTKSYDDCSFLIIFATHNGGMPFLQRHIHQEALCPSS